MKKDERTFEEQILLFRKAGFACINLISKEESVVVDEIRRVLGKDPGTGQVLKYSHASCSLIRSEKNKILKQTEKDSNIEPDELFASFMSLMSVGPDDPTNVIIIPDFGELLRRDPQLRRSLRERIWWCQNSGHQIILLTTKVEELPEIENDITVYHHGLPDVIQTKKLISRMSNDYGLVMGEDDIHQCAESLSGMTSHAQEDAVSLSLVDSKMKGDQKIDPSILLESKEREIAKRPYLKIVKPNVSFDDVVGHDLLKDWAKMRRMGFTTKAKEFGIKTPKGMLLVGPPGTGKTLFAKALTNAWGGMPLLQFNIGAIFNSMLGESEANIREAIEIAERMAPCILWIDEINRAFGGKGGEKDGGTQERITGEILTWMSEKTSQVFVLATANDITGMPPEMLRKGRFDEIFAVGLPAVNSRKNIFELYLSGKENSVDCMLMAEKTDRFIPSEIEEIVSGAHYRAFERFSNSGEGVVTNEDVLAEIEQVVPLSVSMSEQFEALESWSDKNARSTIDKSVKPEVFEPMSRKLNI